MSKFVKSIIGYGGVSIVTVNALSFLLQQIITVYRQYSNNKATIRNMLILHFVKVNGSLNHKAYIKYRNSLNIILCNRSCHCYSNITQTLIVKICEEMLPCIIAAKMEIVNQLLF